MVNWKLLEEETFSGEKVNLVDVIEQNTGQALRFQDEIGVKEFSYSGLIEKVNEFANILNENGAKKGDRVGLFMGKCPEIYFAFLAAIKIGAIAVPLFEAFQTDGLELRLNRGEVNYLFTTTELVERLKNKNPALKKIFVVDSGSFRAELEKQSKHFDSVLVDKKDTAMMIFTSSTAGTPVAGIQIPHLGLVQWIYTGREVLGLKDGTRYWCTAHPAWVTGAVYGVIAPLALGCEVFSIGGRFDAAKWKEFLVKNEITNIYTAPTALKMLKEVLKKGDLKSVKRVCSVGEALPWILVENYEKLGVKIIDTYWQTEVGAIVIANIDFKEKALGKAIGVNIIIKDGEILIKKPWPAMMTGIYQHEKMYEEYFGGEWFKTNDLAEERDGLFYFSGRKDDIIKTSGERVSPLEIENILLKHPAVREAAVIGVPDAAKGEIIKAFVVLKEEFSIAKDGAEGKISADELINNKSKKYSSKAKQSSKAVDGAKLKEELSHFVKENYAGHAYPKIIEFVSELPKNNAGKIVRMELRGK